MILKKTFISCAITRNVLKKLSNWFLMSHVVGRKGIILAMWLWPLTAIWKSVGNLYNGNPFTKFVTIEQSGHKYMYLADNAWKETLNFWLRDLTVSRDYVFRDDHRISSMGSKDTWTTDRPIYKCKTLCLLLFKGVINTIGSVLGKLYWSALTEWRMIKTLVIRFIFNLIIEFFVSTRAEWKKFCSTLSLLDHN